MTRCGRTLGDIGGALPWTALRSFAAHLDASSALAREMDPELGAWASPARVPAMLADIYDAVQWLGYAFACANTGRGKPRPKRPRPYPRPGAKADENRIGRGAIPIREFDEWWSGGDA